MVVLFKIGIKKHIYRIIQPQKHEFSKPPVEMSLDARLLNPVWFGFPHGSRRRAEGFAASGPR